MKRSPLLWRLPVLLLAIAGLTSACDLAASGSEAQSGVQAAAQGQDVAAQSELNSALVAAKTLYVPSSSYAGVSPASLAAFEPGICYVGAATASVASGAACEAGHGASSISVLGQGQEFSAAARSESGTCFWIRDSLGSGVAYGSGEPCTGAAATSAASPSF